MPSLREAAVAGQFYPGSAQELEATVRHFLASAEKKPGAPIPTALIAPHAGSVSPGAGAAPAYAPIDPPPPVIPHRPRRRQSRRSRTGAAIRAPGSITGDTGIGGPAKIRRPAR